MPVATMKIVATGALMLVMLVTIILGATNVNGARGYYHYSKIPKYVCGYTDLPLSSLL
jgi:uncharacterized membrane protein YwzB